MKNTLKNIIKEFAQNRIYFSVSQLKEYLKNNEYDYSDSSIKKYLGQLTKEGFIYNAGRSFYSKLQNDFKAETEEVNILVEKINRKYPYLNFSIWSTKQINFSFHHTQNKFYTFIYSESDALMILRDYLASEFGIQVILNPSKSDLEKISFNSTETIILRPIIIHKLSSVKVATIEKILIDLYIETQRLDIIDLSEYKKVFDYFLSNYRINISHLLDYAERRKILTKIRELLEKYTNPTLSLNVG